MKFSVLAIDFDGTIAQNDRLDLVARAAIADLRGEGITVRTVLPSLATLRRQTICRTGSLGGPPALRALPIVRKSSAGSGVDR